MAVIEKEISLMQEKLQMVLDKDVSPDRKLVEYIFVHLEAAREALTRNGSLRADFFKDIYEVEHARRRVDLWETERIQEILEQGISDGIFECRDAKLTATLLFYSIKGLEQTYFRERISKQIDRNRDEFIRVLFTGLCK